MILGHFVTALLVTCPQFCLGPSKWIIAKSFEYEKHLTSKQYNALRDYYDVELCACVYVSDHKGSQSGLTYDQVINFNC